ncbi:MAG: transcription elongation factor GreA [Oscillospiraceae bacterium]|jgi:transcription elongation factor GreA|nr:transcription elongation factor GreA [Oscillospiraceae bacterium]
MSKQYKITKERLDIIKNELTYLKTVREREVAEQIKVARSFGDLSENSEYDEAKNEQGRVFSRIAELENIVAHAVIIELEALDTNAVSVGCRVTVRDLSGGEDEVYTLVGSQEADPAEMRVSDESPFGKAMLGRTVGEKITLNVPAGKIEYEIVSIDK